MNFIQQLSINTEKPSTLVIQKTDKLKQIAVGLGKNTVLKKHITKIPTHLLVLEGEIDFEMDEKNIILKKGDAFEIPVNIEHEVTGKKEENIFILTQEL